MLAKRLTILALCVFIAAGCSYQNTYLKSYSVGGKYRVKKNENMIEFKYAQVRELDSGISHVLKLRDQQRIVFGSLKEKKLTLKYARDFENGKYVGDAALLTLDVNQMPQIVEVYGFQIRLFKYRDDFLSYQVVKEPDYLDDGAGVFSVSSSQAPPGRSGDDTPDSVKTKKKGLAF